MYGEDTLKKTPRTTPKNTTVSLSDSQDMGALLAGNLEVGDVELTEADLKDPQLLVCVVGPVSRPSAVLSWVSYS